MELKKTWNDGGSLSVTYEGSGDGSAVFSSDQYEGIDREMSVTFKDASESIAVERTVKQEGIRQQFVTADGKVFCVASGGRFGVLKEGGVTPEPPAMETYTRLTYIESTGAQYINTGYVVKEDDVIDMYYITTAVTSADKAMFGVADSGKGIWATIYSNTSYVRFGSTASVTVSDARIRYKINLKKSSVVIDDKNATPTFTQMPTLPLYLFASNNNNNAVNMYGKFISTGFSIKKESGEFVMNLKPCKRDSDGKIGMLDIISGQFFASEGTEDFVGGAEMLLGNEYEAIDYVTFNADKLYDAGIINNTQKIEVLFERSETSKTPYLYGVITSPHTASVTAYLTSSGSWRFGSSYRGFTSNTLKMYKVEISNGTFVGDTTSSTFTKSTFTTLDTLVLGGSRAASGSTSKSYCGLVYYFRVKEGDNYVLDWYPCKRKSDGVEGFWDCITQTFVEPI